MSGAPAESAVEAAGLYKRYAELEAVSGIDFRIERGEYFGFLGPNGAGKTSTLRMVQAVSSPSSGRLRVLGLDPVRDGKRVRARLGVCAQDDTLDPDLPVYDNLRVYGRYFPQDARTTARRAEQLLEFLALNEKRNKKIQELSGGMKRRLMIARALINEPELLVLDEPTTGLDPQARHLIWQKLRELRARGVTLLLTTHYMDEAERLCHRVAIIDHGRKIAEGSPRELIARYIEPQVVEVYGDGAEEWAEAHGRAACERCERTGETVFCYTHDADELVHQLERESGVRYLHRPANLEDVFLKLTGRELRD